jgi:hypothetical protein
VTRVCYCEEDIGDDHIFIFISIFTLVLRCDLGEECALVFSLSLRVTMVSWSSCSILEHFGCLRLGFIP